MRPAALLALGLIALAASSSACAVDAAAFPRAPDDVGDRGRTVWLGTCVNCHGEGFADAPPVTDREAWAPRVAKGKPVLYRHAIEGFFGPQSEMMPPRGGNPKLSDEEVRSAVDYMVYLVTR